MVAHEGEPGNAGLHGRKREAYGTAALGRAFNRSLAPRPCGHEMITRLEHIGEPWQRKPGPCMESFGAIWPDGLMRDSAGAGAEHLHARDDG